MAIRDARRLPADVLARIGADGATQRGVLLEERRHPLEFRAAADGTAHLVGYATTWESAYAVYGGPPWGWDEVMAAGSWDRTLAERDDVRLLLNHEGIPLARTVSGTLTLSADELGLLVDATLDMASPQVQSIRSAMERVDLDQMSCAFEVLRQEWSPDWATRRILEVKGWDVSVVTYPANAMTMALIRGDEPPAPARPAPSTRSLQLARAQLVTLRG